MKTTEIMKIEYSEPLVRVKEVTRRRCVVALSNGSYIVDGEVDATSNGEDWGQQ